MARRTLELYTVLLSNTDLLPRVKTLDTSSPSLQSYASSNTVETLSIPSLPASFLLSKRPLFLTHYWDISLARIVVIILQCFNRIDEGESTATLQTNQVSTNPCFFFLLSFSPQLCPISISLVLLFVSSSLLSDRVGSFVIASLSSD